MWMVQPDVFDNFLIKQAQKTGAKLRDSTEVKGIEFKNYLWEVKTNSEPVSGRYLIAADADGGLMTKWLGLKQLKLCLRACLKTRSIQGESLNFDFGIIKKGWIGSFPQADGYSLSMAAMRGNKPKDIKNILADYATKCGADVSLTNVREHPMSLWDSIANCGSKRRGWLELPPSSPTPCPVRGFGLPFLAALRLLRRSIELLEMPATPRKQYTQTIAQESATVWFGPVAWLGHSISLQERIIEWASNCRVLLSRSAKFCAANCAMPISLTAQKADAVLERSPREEGIFLNPNSLFFIPNS